MIPDTHAQDASFPQVSAVWDTVKSSTNYPLTYYGLHETQALSARALNGWLSFQVSPGWILEWVQPGVILGLVSGLLWTAGKPPAH